VHREGIVLLGGGRALLMQIAHPLVAAGVAEHSNYTHDRVARLLRTIRPMLAITFGSERQALTAAAGVRAIHEHVRGPGYSANDPALLAWVLATLIDTSLLMHDRFVGPLHRCLQERYYDEMTQVGGMLGMPRASLPQDLDAFRRYVADTVETLRVSPEAQHIARDLFQPLPGAGPAMLLARELTAGLLPARLRDAYGLEWDPAREAVLRVLMTASRAVLPVLPASLRQPPAFLLPPPDR
jgi:uncharacterized protein (DUF2236 family)